MDFKTHLLRIWNNLTQLETKKLVALVIVFAVIFAATIGFSVVMNRSATLPLYTNLTIEDVNNISRLLSENQIEFSADPDKGSVHVEPGMVAKARILLAEQGLPSSKASGYDLFDQVNTFGLTSFMQDVTSKRAIEGELVRTIQMIDGISSARVHLVMPEKNVYRRNLVGEPSASVVVKTRGMPSEKSIYAIRNVVAASVPGLQVDGVTIVDAGGTLIAAPGDSNGRGVSKLIEFETRYEQELVTKISNAIGAFLGESNYRVSVSAKLNNDQRKLEEKVFDPESKVARSAQTVREEVKNENRESQSPVGVQQNLPEENPQASNGQATMENSERREEVTNYEINEKLISTQSDGYTIETLSVALVVNNTRINEILGASASQEQLDGLTSELQRIVSAAVSASLDRGDIVAVSMVDFMPTSVLAEEPMSSSIASVISMHLGSILNMLGTVAFALIMVLLGVRPALAYLGQNSPVDSQEETPTEALTAENNQNPQIALSGAGEADGYEAEEYLPIETFDADDLRKQKVSEQLQALVEKGEIRVASALQRWLAEDEAFQNR